MKNKNTPLLLILIGFLFVTKSYSQQRDFVQQILLDKPVTAGKLKLFPGMLNDSNKYYYLPNKLRLTKDANGSDKFLFLYYVTNESNNPEELQSIGKTGGYVHLVVGLQVLPEELEEAKQELKKINRNGVVMGPVIYRGGTMALVSKSVITNSSSTADPNQKRVLGLGPAPVLEGDNVAVSFILDSLDAKILWESLQMPTPDIGFILNMTIGGYQSPVGFSIVMNWDKVYKHKIFNSGLATPILKAEIGVATQEMKENGDLQITEIEGDPKSEKLLDVLTNKFMELCFVPFGSEGSPNWAELAKPLNDGKSFLDRATESLAKETESVERRNKEIRENNAKERLYADEQNRKLRIENLERRKLAQAELAQKQKDVDEARKKAAVEQDAQRKAAAEEDAKKMAAELEEAKQKVALENNLEQKEKDTDAARKLADAETDPVKKKKLEKEADDKENMAKEAQKEVDAVTVEQKDLALALTQPKRVPPKTGNSDGLGEAFNDLKNYAKADKPIEDIPELTPEKKKEEDIPKIAVVASYQQKKIRHSGTYSASKKTYFTTTIAEPFGDNIGKPRCTGCYKKINTFDPLYVQREIVAFLDGQLSAQFSSYVNYVTVMMRKKHAGGDISTKEVRIDRMNFNRSANNFRMLYGWMRGDDDRRNWLNYEYKTAWNFFGGSTIETDWASSDQPVVGLAAPASKYTVEFVADPDRMKELNIKAATVRIFYKLGGQEQMKQASMNIVKGVTSVTLDYLLPNGETEYEYQLELLKGSTNVKSARVRTGSTTVAVDLAQ
ncbi:MAG: hypothetical protein SGI96_20765 [Bacteroidota bacterium]|nr:hypothetical protein [Bacteroidota bacterium]